MSLRNGKKHDNKLIQVLAEVILTFLRQYLCILTRCVSKICIVSAETENCANLFCKNQNNAESEKISLSLMLKVNK